MINRNHVQTVLNVGSDDVRDLLSGKPFNGIVTIFRGASHSLLGAMCVGSLKLHSSTYVLPSSHVLSSLGALTRW